MRDEKVSSELPFFTLPELKMLPPEAAKKIVRLMVAAKDCEDWIIHDHGDVPKSFKENFGFEPEEFLDE